MADTNYYTYKDGTKAELCKGCLTMHINNWEPDTFLWLLEKFDVPYMPEEWISLRDKAFAKDPYKMNGMSVIGKYLAKMKLNQWKEFRWKDNDHLRELENLKIEQTMKQQGYDAGEIALAIEKKNSVAYRSSILIFDAYGEYHNAFERLGEVNPNYQFNKNCYEGDR